MVNKIWMVVGNSWLNGWPIAVGDGVSNMDVGSRSWVLLIWVVVRCE